MYHGPTYVVSTFLWKCALGLGLIALIAGNSAAATVGKTGADVIGQGVGVTAASLKQAGTSFTSGKAAGDAAKPVGPLLNVAPAPAAVRPGQTRARPLAPRISFNLPAASLGTH